MTSIGRHAPARQMLAGTTADYILLAVVLAGIVVSWLTIHTSIGTGVPTVYIYHDRMLVATYPLPGDDHVIRFDAHGELGTSEIVIDRSGARIVHSPCLTQHCVLSGVHRHIGDMIACVPNHILVSIRGSGEMQGRLDAVAE